MLTTEPKQGIVGDLGFYLQDIDIPTEKSENPILSISTNQKYRGFLYLAFLEVKKAPKPSDRPRTTFERTVSDESGIKFLETRPAMPVNKAARLRRV